MLGFIQGLKENKQLAISMKDTLNVESRGDPAWTLVEVKCGRRQRLRVMTEQEKRGVRGLALRKHPLAKARDWPSPWHHSASLRRISAPMESKALYSQEQNTLS